MTTTIRHACAFAALLALFAAGAHAAGQATPLPDPADAAAPVPPTRYQPALSAPPAATEAGSPADNWKARNQAVASYDSMSLTMDMAAPQAAAPAAAGKPIRRSACRPRHAEAGST